MNYAGSLKKKDGKPSQTKAKPSNQPETKERSSEELLALLRPSEKKKPPGPRFPNQGASWSVESKKPPDFKLERNFPKRGNVVFQEHPEDKKKRLLRIVDSYESPFQIKPPVGQTSVSRLKEKIKEVQEERVGLFKWRNFCLNLALSLEYYQASDVESSMRTIEQLESAILKIGVEDGQDYFFNGIYDALDYVVTASKAYLLLQMDKSAEAEKLLPRILPVDRMRRCARAGLFGIRAAVLMEYGLWGNQLALKQLTSALELDKSTAEWFFMKGKCLARIRRMAAWNDEVSIDEEIAFDQAIRRDEKNPIYLIYLAQCLRDKAFRDMKNNQKPVETKIYGDGKRQVRSKESNKNDEVRKKTEKIFFATNYKMREAVGKSPDNPRLLVRAASTMLKMPFRFADVKLASDWLDKALEKAPNNSMAHHTKGILLERFYTDPDRAMEELSIAEQLGNYAAALGVVKMAFKLGHDNIIERLDRLSTVFSDSHRLENTYAQAGSYLLFIKKDIISAATYFLKVIDLNSQSYHMKCHKSLFLRMENPVNLFHVLQTELSESVEWATFAKEDQKLLRTLSIKMYPIIGENGKNEKVYVRNLLDQAYHLSSRDAANREKPPKKKFVWKKKDKKTKKEEKKVLDKKLALAEWNEKLLDSKLTPDAMSLSDKYSTLQHRGDIQSEFSASHTSLQRYPSNSSLSSRTSSICSDVRQNKYCESRNSTGGISDFDYAANRVHRAGSESSDTESVISSASMMDSRRASVSSARSSSSVMERVKQSYKMLDYKKSESEERLQKLNRTDSTQSLHTGQTGSTGLQRRTGSVQSLDSLDMKFKPTFTHSSSNRSSTFLPKFAKQ